MTGVKTNERPGTRAVLRHCRMSATKARQVLDLVRGADVDRAHEILRATPREGARVVAKVLESAVSNARNNDGLDPDELYVSAAYADEGTTIKRWRPRARGRAARIRKRTCHITLIVSRLPEDRLLRRQARQAATTGALRSRRVAASRRREPAPEAAEAVEVEPEELAVEEEPAEVDDELESGDVVEDELETDQELDVEDDEPEVEDRVEVEEDEPAADEEPEAEVASDVGADDEEAEAPAPRRRRRLSRGKKTEDSAEDGGSEESD